jgi:hypothetical protein
MTRTLARAIAEALASFVDVFEDAVPDYGPFTTHTVALAPSRHDYRLGAIELSIGAFRPDDTDLWPTRRYLQVKAHTPSGKSHSRAWIKTGTKTELLSAVHDPATVQVVEEVLARMAESLHDNDFA